MNKLLLKTVFALFVALIAITGCENPVAEPSGTLTPQPGLPPGMAGNYGVPDPAFTGRRFDINNLPSPATWNALGHQHAFPDLFHFANGNKVVTLADWELRRKEISKILQYYEYGVMPPLAEADGVQITWQDSAGGATSAITIKNTKNGKDWSITIETTLPANANEANKYDPATGTGGYPLYFGTSGANWTGGSVGSFPMSGTWANEADGTGNVPDLFDINTSDPSAPSANISYAWGMSVILTVIEEGGFGGWYNPAQVGVTGYSRNGKAAECIGAFAESRKGHRVGHVGIGSAGSGGPALERFISLAGYKVNGQWADPLPVNASPPDPAGLMNYDGLIGKPYYVQKISDGDDIFPGLAGSPKYGPTPGGRDDASRYTLVRGWAPYFEPYIATPTNDNYQGVYPEGGHPTATNGMTTPFVGFQTPSNSWSGIQSLSEARNETPGWFSNRFQEFFDLHYGLDIDHVRGQEGRGKYGILCTIPFDQHFLAALIAPNGVLFQDGYTQTRNNQESQFANWLIIDELYKFYGEQEGSPDKYIWRNGFVMTWGDHGGNNGNEGPDRAYHAAKIFDGTTDNAQTALADSNLAKMRAPWFPIDDPVGAFDYYRMTWGRPGHPTIAQRVKARLPDALLTHYKSVDEAARPAPAAGQDPNWRPANYNASAYTGPKFKAMDWRGLTDTPDAL
ncbi:MAG: hypothetical protein LBQ88_07390 [Treponema sp.]|nr:hypothetical protein [Treponema sp.]